MCPAFDCPGKRNSRDVENTLRPFGPSGAISSPAIEEAPKEEAKRIATYIPRWGIWLAAHLLESKACAMYRDRLKRFASLIADREPRSARQLPGMGTARRHIITIADDDRRPLDKLCQEPTARPTSPAT